ncbi:hypothetical protein DESPIG_00398, partial [Desulfovibrio piger ATCC 29098]
SRTFRQADAPGTARWQPQSKSALFRARHHSTGKAGMPLPSGFRGPPPL